MKTILYSVIAIFMFGIIAMGFTQKAHSKNVMLIQAVDQHVPLASLTQSAQIITNRLKDFSSKKFSVTVIPEKNQIQVTLFNAWNLQIAEHLMVEKGALGFYETYNRTSLAEILNNPSQLFSLINIGNSNDTAAELGCASVMDTAKINAVITTFNITQKCKFAWNSNDDRSELCLYALKTDQEKGALLVNEEIESVRFTRNKSAETNEVAIRFKESAKVVWAEITQRNLGHAIAIVLDHQVLAAPIVQSVINGGNCTLTGNFTPDQAGYIAAMGNNGTLPLSFKRLK